MVTETLILTGTKIQSIDQHQHSIGGDLSAPVLSIAGITIPTPLDPSVGAATVRESKHERGVSVPERMVFAIRYMRVKLLRRKRGDATKTGVNDYRLESKANWTPMFDRKRGSTPDWADDDPPDSDDNDEQSEDGNDEGGGEVLEPILVVDDRDYYENLDECEIPSGNIED